MTLYFDSAFREEQKASLVIEVSMSMNIASFAGRMLVQVSELEDRRRYSSGGLPSTIDLEPSVPSHLRLKIMRIALSAKIISSLQSSSN